MTKKATVVGLDGQPIKQRRSLRDPVVTEMLKRAGERNKQGEVGAIVVITVAPDGTPTQMYHWGDAPDVFSSMIGSMEIAKHSLIGHAINSADVDYIDGSEDA